MTEFEKLLLGSIDPVSVVIWDTYNRCVLPQTIRAAKEAYAQGCDLALIKALAEWNTNPDGRAVGRFFPAQFDYDWLMPMMESAVNILMEKEQS